VLSSGILIRQRGGVTGVRKPGISTHDSPNFGELLIRESDEDPVRGSGAWTSTNQRGSKDQFGNLLRQSWWESIHEPGEKQSQSCCPKKSGFRVWTSGRFVNMLGEKRHSCVCSH
jgi:hypothetical protein